MGKANSGPLGPAKGKIGNLVWYNLNGQQVVRTVGTRTAKASEAQLTSRNKVKIVMDLFKHMKPFIKAGFINEATGTSSSYHNKATSYQLLHAVKLSNGIPYLDYSAVKLSVGTGLMPENCTVAPIEQGLKFSWTFNEQEDWKYRRDRVMMLAYFPEDKEAIYTLSGSRREIGADVLEMHSEYRAKAMEVYISFVSEDRRQVSNSSYLGRILSTKLDKKAQDSGRCSQDI